LRHVESLGAATERVLFRAAMITMNTNERATFGTASAVVHRRYAPARSIDVQCDRYGGSWLGERERTELSAWRDARRQRAWLRGRMLGKQLVSTKLCTAPQPATTEILSGDGRGRPRVWLDGVEQPWSLSISHTEMGVLVAICQQPETLLGVDLTPCEALSNRFIRLWFTPAEVAWLDETPSANNACFLWAAKEAIYKACNQSESFDPRHIEVLPTSGCRFHGVRLEDCRLQSWSIDRQIAVLATIGYRANIALFQQQSTLISASLQARAQVNP
jgi:phosphopantetheinyl transferase